MAITARSNRGSAIPGIASNNLPDEGWLLSHRSTMTASAASNT
jgi:hypothetical protein